MREPHSAAAYPLSRSDGFFDRGSVTAVEARDGWVDVMVELLVLD